MSNTNNTNTNNNNKINKINLSTNNKIKQGNNNTNNEFYYCSKLITKIIQFPDHKGKFTESLTTILGNIGHGIYKTIDEFHQAMTLMWDGFINKLSPDYWLHQQAVSMKNKTDIDVIAIKHKFNIKTNIPNVKIPIQTNNVAANNNNNTVNNNSNINTKKRKEPSASTLTSTSASPSTLDNDQVMTILTKLQQTNEQLVALLNENEKNYKRKLDQKFLTITPTENFLKDAYRAPLNDKEKQILKDTLDKIMLNKEDIQYTQNMTKLINIINKDPNCVHDNDEIDICINNYNIVTLRDLQEFCRNVNFNLNNYNNQAYMSDSENNNNANANSTNDTNKDAIINNNNSNLNPNPNNEELYEHNLIDRKLKAIEAVKKNRRTIDKIKNKIITSTNSSTKQQLVDTLSLIQNKIVTEL